MAVYVVIMTYYLTLRVYIDYYWAVKSPGSSNVTMCVYANSFYFYLIDDIELFIKIKNKQIVLSFSFKISLVVISS